MLRVAEHWAGTDTGLQRRANERFFRFHVAGGNCGQLGFFFSEFYFHAFGFCQRRG